MKKLTLRVLSACLCIAIVLPIAGCNKKKREPRSRVVQETDPYFTCEEFELDFGDPDGRDLDYRSIRDSKVFSDCVVASVQEEYVQPLELQERYDSFHYNTSNIEEYKQLLDEVRSYSRDGLAVFGLDGKLKKFNVFTSGTDVVGMAEDASGKAKILLRPYEESTYMYGSSVLYDISPDGELTNEVVLDRTIGWTNMLFLENGSFFCYDPSYDSSSVLLYDANGKLLSEERLGFGSNIVKFFRIGEKFYVYFLTGNPYDPFATPTTYMFELDPSTGKKIGEKLELTCRVHGELLMPWQNGVYATLGNGIKKYDLLTGQDPQTILSWSDTDCVYTGIESSSTYFASDNDIYVLRETRGTESFGYIGRGGSTSLYLMHLHRLEKNPNAGKSIIYLTSIGTPEGDFLKLINTYNTDPGKKTRIVVLDYAGEDLYASTGSEMMSSWSALKALKTNEESSIVDQIYLDILSGDGPDILLNFGSFSQFNTERALVDLNTLIDGSKPLDRKLFFDNILRACERDGKLYQMPLSFSVAGMLANKEYSGERIGWTYEEFRNLEQDLPQGVRLMGNVTQSELLETLMNGATSHLLNYDKRIVNFDDPEFREILRMVKDYGIPKTNVDLQAELEYDDSLLFDAQMFVAGTLVAMSASFHDPQQFADLYHYCDGNVCLVGNPSVDGNGAKAEISSSIAISQTSQFKDEAWDFLRCMFEEKNQLVHAIRSSGMPINRTAFDDLVDLSFESDRIRWKMTETDSNMARWLPMESVHMDEKHIEALLKVIEGIQESCSSDPTAMMIIEEEAPGYFTGDRTVDEVIKIIQKRSKAVVQERG